MLWSLAYRTLPAEDTAIVKNRGKAHGPPFDMSGKRITEAFDSALLIDATLKAGKRQRDRRILNIRDHVDPG